MPNSRQSSQPRTLASIQRQLSRAAKHEDTKPYEVDELLRAAARIDETEPHLIAKFMLDELVIRCVSTPPADGHGQARSRQLRRLLVDWINSLPEDRLWGVRRAVMEGVIDSLRSAPTFEGMYSLAAIGYRSPEVVQILSALGERDDGLGHEAMRLLINFRPSPALASWIRNRIRSTPYERRTEELLNAAAQLRDKTLLPFLAADALRRGPGWFALARLLWVGQDAPGDPDTQDAVWRAIARVSRGRKDGRNDLAIIGGVMQYCHSPLALRAMLRAATTSTGRGPSRLLTQVAEAESPMQLRGWIGAPIGKIVGAVARAVEGDTGNTGVGQTLESVNKDIALEALLCSGSNRIDEILAEGIANETNVYTTAELMRALAMFPTRRLPPRVKSALSDARGFTSRADEGPRLVVYLAAARVAASSRSFEEFEALVGSRGLVNGHPLTVPVRNAVEQLLWLARRQRSDAVSWAVRGLESSSPFSQIVAARSLCALLQDGPADEALPELTSLANNRGAQPYIRTAAIAAAAVANRAKGDGAWRGVLARLCDDPDAAVQYAAASALIDTGAFHEAIDVVGRLAEAGGDAARRSALLVGQLVAVHPERHIEAAQAAMSSGGDLLHDVLDGFQLGGKRDAPTSLPIALADVAIRQIVRDESAMKSDAPLLADVADVSPRRILTESWPLVWHRWMPHSRCVLAEVLPEAVRRAPDLEERAVELLTLLVKDGSFAVRRSAARSLSRVRRVALVAWCDEAYRSVSIHVRRLAMDAAAWLESDSDASLDNAVVRAGRADAEATVRDAAERAGREMRRRSWARSLLADMKSGAHDDERHVYTHYRTGRALARVGDDEDLQALDALRRDPACPPNVAYWFEKTREELEKQWKKTTAEWPDPWLHWNAAIERVDGMLSIGTNIHVVEMHLWRRRGKGAEGISGWGGAGRIEMDHSLGVEQTRDEVTLTIAGRQPARALVASVSHSLGARTSEIVLTGNGPYPRHTVPREDE